LVQHRVLGVDFDVGVFTNLTHDHLDFHGTMEAYFEAKALLFSQRLKQGGRAVLNADDPYVARLLTPAAIAFSVKGDERAQVRLESERLLADGTELEVRTPRYRLSLRSPLVGRFNLENTLAAVAVGEALGLSAEVITEGIATVRSVPGRLERVSDAGQPLVVVDYAHTPDALEKVLTALRPSVGADGELVCVFGAGGERDPGKRPEMGKIAASLADRVVITSDNPRGESPSEIASAVSRGVRETGNRRWGIELDRANAIAGAIAEAKAADVVLLAGKGHETYQEREGMRIPFSDVDEAERALSSWGNA
jgi:UDP-N-acetylmuramoyl-L-alanyl-D-glutamate--2,6-diaminopimelate ligase